MRQHTYPRCAAQLEAYNADTKFPALVLPRHRPSLLSADMFQGLADFIYVHNEPMQKLLNRRDCPFEDALLGLDAAKCLSNRTIFWRILPLEKVRTTVPTLLACVSR